jgi:hypothetical protein
MLGAFLAVALVPLSARGGFVASSVLRERRAPPVTRVCKEPLHLLALEASTALSGSANFCRSTTVSAKLPQARTPGAFARDRVDLCEVGARQARRAHSTCAPCSSAAYAAGLVIVTKS